MGRGHHQSLQRECNFSKILPAGAPTNTVSFCNHVGVHTQAIVAHHQCTPCTFPPPEYHNPNKITERILLAFFCMVDSSRSLHLGSVLATSFATAIGGNRRYITSMGPYITRLAHHLNVNLAGCTSEGALHGVRRGNFAFHAFTANIWIISVHLGTASTTKGPSSRAPSRRRRPALHCPAPPPPPPPASSSGVGPSPSGVHHVERMDRLEIHVVGVTSRLDRHTVLLERIARRQGLLLDDESGPST
ncbi:unnamed protein product [Linum trigynum]|uniref:Uncharacterized protein n=1 Tax=Linum trigynum TaxID=586398 RepID=A0AAV2F8V2_9ROSI